MHNNDLNEFSFRNNSGTAQYSMDDGNTWQNFKNPTGNRSITANGTYDVTDYASADVNVPWVAPGNKIKEVNNAAYTTTQRCFVIVTIVGSARGNGTAVPAISFSIPSQLGYYVYLSGYSSGCCSTMQQYMGICPAGVTIPKASSSGGGGYNLTLQNISCYSIP